MRDEKSNQCDHALWRTLEAAPTSDITKCGNTVESESAVESEVSTDGVESPLESNGWCCVSVGSDLSIGVQNSCRQQQNSCRQQHDTLGILSPTSSRGRRRLAMCGYPLAYVRLESFPAGCRGDLQPGAGALAYR